MMRSALLIMVACVLAGCACARVVDTDQSSGAYADINQTAQQETAWVQLRDGQTIQATDLHVASDTAVYVDENGQMQSVATEEIAQVTFIRHDQGALEGLGIGVLVGAVAGGLIGAATYDGPEIITNSRASSAAVYALVLNVLTAPIGVIAGVARGSRVVYQFHADAPSIAGGTQGVSSSNEGTPK